MNRGISALAVVAAFVAAGGASAQTAMVGEKMAYAFQQPIMNGQGVKSLDDLRGRPVVVEFWGTR